MRTPEVALVGRTPSPAMIDSMAKPSQDAPTLECPFSDERTRFRAARAAAPSHEGRPRRLALTLREVLVPGRQDAHQERARQHIHVVADGQKSSAAQPTSTP